MGFLSALVGGGVAQPIEAIGNVFDKLFTSDEEKAQAKAVLAKMAQEPHILQAEINKIEASHRSILVAGWRPFIGWVCGVSLGTYFIPKFTLAAVLWAMKSWELQELLPYPVDGADLMQVIFALLGLGGLRTAEKFAGRAK